MIDFPHPGCLLCGKKDRPLCRYTSPSTGRRSYSRVCRSCLRRAHRFERSLAAPTVSLWEKTHALGAHISLLCLFALFAEVGVKPPDDD